MDTEDTDQTVHRVAASRRRAWRGAALAAALIAVALALTACGGASPHTSGSSRSPGASSSPASSPEANPTHAKQAVGVSKLLKFAECMRSHGVTDYPNPSPSGLSSLPNPNSPTYQAAQRACSGLLPNNGTKS
jgi:hypothetical protein